MTRIAAAPPSTRPGRPRPFAERLQSIPLLLIIALVLIVTVYPLVWMLLSSFKTADEFSSGVIWALPKSFSFDNFVRAWTVGKMNLYFLNSLLSVIPSLALVILLGVGAAFGLEIMRWRLKTSVSLLFLLGIMIPIQMVLLPLFTMYFKAHLLDTRWALILTYTVFGLPTTIFFLTGYFKNFAREIIEAAIVDGANIYQVFWKVVLPMVMNSVVTVALVQFFFMWNDLLVSLTFINNPDLRTIQAGLLNFAGQYGQREWGPTFASVTLAVAPTVIVYLLLNQKIMKGLAAGAVKG
ncbi:carbohydrate ABC transporter permease [Deinococcus ruber]|uniref:ABC transporter permease n=1 Tax=Deinococcus ruber TaxID=1848197 RepID=A0A918CL76_9DEIO|nr:carbohydrate ABC transporter permease [Deinococcus ruber]GGR28962.1 ABC transporter permease [Deinococcus ruber]